MSKTVENLYKRLEEKMSEKLGYRGDLYLADYKGINHNTAKVLIGFNESLGYPNISELSKFVIKSFEGRISPKLETARIHPQNEAISLIVAKVRVTRPIGDKNKMVAIAATLFLDQELGNRWEVEKKGDKVFLARIDDEDITDIVSQRFQSKQIKASVTFDKLTGTAYASVQNGDTVKYFKDNEIYQGKVISIGPTKATIRSDGVASVVDPAAIFEVVKVGTSSRQETENTLRDYYKKAYPENYGKMLIDLYQ